MFVAETPEAFSYDADPAQRWTSGNPAFGGTGLLSDARLSYTWDAEYRLVAMQTDTNKVGTAVPAPAARLVFD